MEFTEIISAIGNTSTMLIMAGLFIWAYFQDKTKNQSMLEDIKEVVKALSVSNENIAKSLEIISHNCASVETKVEKNHDLLIEMKNK